MMILLNLASCIFLCQYATSFTTRSAIFQSQQQQKFQHVVSIDTSRRPQQQQQRQITINRLSLSSKRKVTTTVTAATGSIIPDFGLLKKLPWNVRKEKLREQRRLQLERAKLHRQLGIVEDATYEEIVAATDRLIAAAGNNLKQKVQIEIAKDKILQIRLNERLAGLITNNQEARAQSTYELEGADDNDDIMPKRAKEFSAPAWTKGLIVKPDEKHLKSQLRLWGILTGIGIALPPAQDYLGRFTWLVCVAQLTFRGMPQEMREGGGMGMSFNMGSGKGGHRKVAFALGFATWIVGAIIAYGLMPSWAKGQRWTASVAFTIQNLIFGLVSCYLQPYKG